MVKQLEGRADAKNKQVMHIVKVAWLYVGSPARRLLLQIAADLRNKPRRRMSENEEAVNRLLAGVCQALVQQIVIMPCHSNGIQGQPLINVFSAQGHALDQSLLLGTR
jgi:hypothetical protein